MANNIQTALKKKNKKKKNGKKKKNDFTKRFAEGQGGQSGLKGSPFMRELLK